MMMSVTISAKGREYRIKRVVMDFESRRGFVHVVLCAMHTLSEIPAFEDLADQISFVEVLGRYCDGVDEFVRCVEVGTDWRLIVQDCKTGKYFGVPEKQEKLEGQTDSIDHPQHYQLPGLPCESIDVIRAVLGDEGFCKFCRGNALKYLIRADHKGGTEDLKKAMKYIGWERDTREGRFSPRERDSKS